MIGLAHIDVETCSEKAVAIAARVDRRPRGWPEAVEVTRGAVHDFAMMESCGQRGIRWGGTRRAFPTRSRSSVLSVRPDHPAHRGRRSWRSSMPLGSRVSRSCVRPCRASQWRTGLAEVWLYNDTDFGEGRDRSPQPVLRAVVEVATVRAPATFQACIAMTRQRWSATESSRSSPCCWTTRSTRAAHGLIESNTRSASGRTLPTDRAEFDSRNRLQ